MIGKFKYHGRFLHTALPVKDLNIFVGKETDMKQQMFQMLFFIDKLLSYTRANIYKSLDTKKI